MALKNFNPTTPSRRSLVLVNKSKLHKGAPVKKLTHGLTKTGGRNNKGELLCGGKAVVIKEIIELLTLREKKDDKSWSNKIRIWSK